MKSIKQTYFIKSSVGSVWSALVDPEKIDDWGAGSVKMDDREGSKFSLWGGDIWGKNKEVVPNKKLVQEWYGGDWDKPSIVTFSLKKKDGGTQVDLTHEDLPDNEIKDHEKGWKDYYLGPLKDFVEKNN